MKKLLFWGVLALMACTSACTSAFKRGPSSEYKPRHIIVTVHGVRGNRESFGDFHSIIKQHLEKVDPAYEVHTINFTYPVGVDGYEPYKHANSMNVRITDYLKAQYKYGSGKADTFGKLDPRDRISILGYSMGGQVALAWYTATSKDPKYSQYVKQLDTFMNLGAVYWGAAYSESAMMDFAQPLSKINDDFFGGMIGLGGVDVSEVAELSPVSASTLRLRNDRIEQVQNSINLNPKAQFVSLIGLWPCEFENAEQRKVPGCQYNPEKATALQEKIYKVNQEAMSAARNLGVVSYGFFGGVRHESDGPVRSTSANYDFIYAQDLSANYKHYDILDQSKFINTANVERNSKNLMLDIIHATIPAPQWIKEQIVSLEEDMVIVKNECLEPQTCNNPTYAMMLKYLARCDREGSTCVSDAAEFMSQYEKYPEGPTQKILTDEMQGFVLDLNLRIPSSYIIPSDVKENHRNLLKYVRFDWKDGRIPFNSPRMKDVMRDGILSSTSKDYYLNLARYNELGNLVYKRIPGKDGYDNLLISFQGRFNMKSGADRRNYYRAKSEGVPVKFRIGMPGLKIRDVIAPVRHTYSTYVDVVLAP